MLFYVLAFLFLGHPAPTVGEGTTLSVAAQHLLPTIVAPARLPTEAAIVTAITKLEAKGSPISPENKARYAKAILAAATTHRIDPYLLVAIARVESDFTNAQRTDYRCKLRNSSFCSQDCGITQQNVAGKPAWVLLKCAQITKSPEASFDAAAEELAKHALVCSQKLHLDKIPERCILQKYNGGPAYRRTEHCKRGHACEALPLEHQGKCKASRRRCMIMATYWTRVLCFAEGARTARTPVKNCRWCWDAERIKDHYRD
jgi:hypothetical protein